MDQFFKYMSHEGQGGANYPHKNQINSPRTIGSPYIKTFSQSKNINQNKIIERDLEKGFNQNKKKKVFKSRGRIRVSSPLQSTKQLLGNEEMNLQDHFQNNFNNNVQKEKIDNYLKNILDLSLKEKKQNVEEQNYFKDNVIKINLNFQQKQLQNDLSKKQVLSLWLGQVFQKCTSSSFKHFITKNLDYNEAKAYCCEQILTNLVSTLRKFQNQNFNSLLIDKGTSQKQKLFQNRYFEFLNEQCSKIITYLLSKYPQNDVQGVNKQVAEIVEQMKIDNWADDQYDLIRKSDVKFEYNLDGNYSKDIMNFLNFLIKLPFQKHHSISEMTNYKYFELVMTRIFNIVFSHDSKDDLSKILNETGNVDLKQPKIKLTEEELEYSDKVKKYTQILIGSKIPSSTKLFNQDQIDSGIIQIDNNQIARVIDKWAEQLRSKFMDVEKVVLNRKHRFKSENQKNFYKLNEEVRESLFEIISEKKKKLEDFMRRLKLSLFDLSHRLMIGVGDSIYDMDFLKERQKHVAEFAIKMADSSSVYFIEIIQKQISFLLESIQILKKKWLKIYNFKQSPSYEVLNIDLITFKIGDLMRCKMTSKQEEIIRILNAFRRLSEMSQNKLIKIVRVKNRLESGTRDILINFVFDNICVCQLQLAVAERVSEKQQYFDKFNHFLYQIQRAYLGPIMQMCRIWCQYENKSEIFAKKIKMNLIAKQKQIKISSQFQDLDIESNLYEMYQFNFPFVCHSCRLFCLRNQIIYYNSCFNNRLFCGNCLSVKISLNKSKVASIKKKYLFNKYLMRYPHFNKFLAYINQINNIDEVQKKKFQIHIPTKSRFIHLRFSMLALLQKQNSKFEEYIFITTRFKKDGQLTQQTCRQKIYVKRNKNEIKKKEVLTIEQMQSNIKENYIFYGWDLPTLMIPYPQQTGVHYTEMIDVFLPEIKNLQLSKGYYNVKIGAVKLPDEKYYYFPFFMIDEIRLSDQLIMKKNQESLIDTLKRKQEVIQISNSNITNQFDQISPNNKIIMGHTIKQLYIRSNQLKSLSFIQYLHVLKIVDASKNFIVQIPNIPHKLEQLNLSENKISKINEFAVSDEKCKVYQNYQLISLDLSKNNIQKIENLQGFLNLKNLHLNMNNIEKIEGIAHNVEVLGLFMNSITNISNLKNIKNLINLSLSSNKISKIQNLDNCLQIRFLSLDGNNIKRIQNLQTLQKLEVLRLNSTSISCKNIDRSCLYKGIRGIKKLKKLFVQNNQITNLLEIVGGILNQNKQILNQINKEKNAFNPLIQLEQLSLNNNQISDISDYDELMPVIKIFNISSNKISNVTNITSFIFLRELNLSQNYICNLPEFGWEKIFHLRVLNVSHNNIMKVPDLEPLLYIQNLDFSRNKIREIKKLPRYPAQFSDLQRFIDLSYNELFNFSDDSVKLQIVLSSLSKGNQYQYIYLYHNMANQQITKKLKMISERKGLTNNLFFEENH